MFEDDNNGTYPIIANDGGYYIRGDFTSNTHWGNLDYSGTPQANYHVEEGGRLYDFKLSGSAQAHVSSGGKAEDIQVQSGGSLYISGGEFDSLTVLTGGNATNIQIQSGGLLCISGGTLESITVFSGANVDVGNKNKFAVAALTGTNIVSQGASLDSMYEAASGKTATLNGSHTLSAGLLFVNAGAITSDLCIKSFGEVTVRNSGQANSVVLSDGKLIVENGGTASATQINSGTLIISKGGIASNTSISGGIASDTSISGGIATVNGSAIRTTIFSGGCEKVEGGQTTSTIISGGLQKVTNSGKVTKTVVNTGSLDIEGGIASNVEIRGAGEMIMSGNAKAFSTTIVSGSMVTTGKNCRTSHTSIGLGATQTLNGGIDYFATVNGSQVLFGNASAFSGTVSQGGTLLNSGGLVRAATIESGGTISSVATTSAIVISGQAFIAGKDFKAQIYGTQQVENGGIAISATIYDGAKQILSDGTASNTTISSGGTQTVSGYGFASGILVAGTLNVVQGVASATTISKDGIVKVASGASVDTQVIKNGGTLTVSSGGMLTSATVSSGGKLIVSAGGTTFSLTAKKGAIISGGSTKNEISVSQEFILAGSVNAKKFHACTTQLGSLAIKVAGTDNSLGSFKDNVGSDYLQVSDTYLTRLSYDLSSVKPGSNNLLSLTSTSKLRCYCTIQTAKNQGIGTYKLSKGLNLIFGKNSSDTQPITIKVGTASISAKTGQTVKKNGMQYKLSLSNNQFNLSLGLVHGAMRKGTSKKDTLKGTANSDIFYGGKNNDTISGINGRDVAVYDKTAWGKDTIAKTSGTMTLLFKDLKEKDIKTSVTSGGTMTITRKSDTKQTITVKNWSKSTHNILYGSGMNAFNRYLNAAKPTNSQITAARTEAFKKAGLAAS